ncbi:MAG: hypothetical protein CV087_08795 [Candidatus Brocadia sp. WS118]|nr:MAG: hypothetical protein CV087_08795 [Candidatus Brocadia sp. WS118]
MVTTPIILAGESYKHKSLPLSAQQTINFYPQMQPNAAEKSNYILESWHGKTLFGTVSGGLDRGMFEHLGILYKVTGTTLYSVASDGTHTSLGTISGSARCIFAGIQTNVIICSAGTAYQWDGATLTTISDVDLESPNSVAHINNQIIYQGTGGRFGVSDVGDATSINGLNYATAESEPDNLVRVYTFNQTLYLLGEKTVEPWVNTGEGNPPFDRIEGGLLNVGCGALHSVANDDNYIYFLDDSHSIVSLRGSATALVETISTPAMSAEIKNYSTVSDAIGWCLKIDGQSFYVITFPTANKTWISVRPRTVKGVTIGGDWFELSSGVSGRDISNSYAYCFRKHLVADYSNGNIYELSDSVYTENGDPIIRIRDTAPIHGGLIKGAIGKSIEMNRFELILETGVGVLSGQGFNPEIMLSFSDDGGKTFCAEMFGTIGRLGEFQYKVEWFALGSFYSRIIRIRTSDPVYYSIHSASADIDVGI